MKKIRAFEINSILQCKYIFYRMPEDLRRKQLELHEKIDAHLEPEFDADKIYDKSILPTVSSDDAWAALSSSEKELCLSLENGGLSEAGEAYDIATTQLRMASQKT